MAGDPANPRSLARRLFGITRLDEAATATLREYSPQHQRPKTLPPTLLVVGTADRLAVQHLVRISPSWPRTSRPWKGSRLTARRTGWEAWHEEPAWRVWEQKVGDWISARVGGSKRRKVGPLSGPGLLPQGSRAGICSGNRLSASRPPPAQRAAAAIRGHGRLGEPSLPDVSSAVDADGLAGDELRGHQQRHGAGDLGLAALPGTRRRLEISARRSWRSCGVGGALDCDRLGFVPERLERIRGRSGGSPGAATTR